MSSLQPAAGTRVRLARLERRRGLDGGSRRLRGAFFRFAASSTSSASTTHAPPFVFSALREAGVSGARAEVRAGSGVPPCPARAVLGVASASASRRSADFNAPSRRRRRRARSLFDVAVSRLFAFRFSNAADGEAPRGGSSAPRGGEARRRRRRTRRNPRRVRARGSPPPGKPRRARGARLERGDARRDPDEVFSLRTRGEVFSLRRARERIERSNASGAASNDRAASAAARAGEPGSEGFDASSSTSSYSSESLAERGASEYSDASLGNAGGARVRRPTRPAPREPQTPSSHPRLSPRRQDAPRASRSAAEAPFIAASAPSAAAATTAARHAAASRRWRSPLREPPRAAARRR